MARTVESCLQINFLWKKCLRTNGIYEAQSVYPVLHNYVCVVIEAQQGSKEEGTKSCWRSWKRCKNSRGAGKFRTKWKRNRGGIFERNFAAFGSRNHWYPCKLIQQTHIACFSILYIIFQNNKSGMIDFSVCSLKDPKAIVLPLPSSHCIKSCLSSAATMMSWQLCIAHLAWNCAWWSRYFFEAQKCLTTSVVQDLIHFSYNP